jgi:hypothetical protein
MEKSKWRAHARKVIDTYIEQHKPTSAVEFKKGVSKVYPFGMRSHHPYKIWLDEVKRAAERVEHTPTPEALRNYWLNPLNKKG